MKLPPDFISTIQNVFAEQGHAFLKELPNLVDEAAARWGLTDVQPVPNLSYNFVAFAKRRPSPFGRGQGEGDVILKMGVPNRELTSEMAALSCFNGDGACRLIESDEARGFLLLERLVPGKMLAELEDDDERTHIAAEVMQRMGSASSLAKIEQQAVRLQSFIKLSDWFDGVKRIRPHFNGGTGPFPKEILGRVESFLPELFADKDIKLLHGDFHHFNILLSDRGWLVIDPKGVIGPAGYEVGPFMLNPWGSISDAPQFKARAERRVGIFSERFGWEREKIIKWATAHAVLSAWWSIEDNDGGWEYSMECAALFSEIK